MQMDLKVNFIKKTNGGLFMFYVKEKINDSMEISIEINDENVFCTCPKCGKEVRVDLVEVLEEGDLVYTQVCCNTCSETMRGIYE